MYLRNIALPNFQSHKEDMTLHNNCFVQRPLLYWVIKDEVNYLDSSIMIIIMHTFRFILTQFKYGLPLL